MKYTWKALPALITPIILLGGIYTGIVTPTEAGAIAALYAIVISAFVYKVLSLKDFLDAVKNTVKQTAYIMVMAIGAFVISHVVSSFGISDGITEWFLKFTQSKYAFMIMVNLFFLILGMFLDIGVIQFVFLPLVIPVAIGLPTVKAVLSSA